MRTIILCAALALSACAQQAPPVALQPSPQFMPGYQPAYPPYERPADAAPALSGNLAAQGGGVHLHQGDVAVCQ